MFLCIKLRTETYYSFLIRSETVRNAKKKAHWILKHLNMFATNFLYSPVRPHF